MSKACNAHIERLLKHAESNRECLVANERGDGRLLRYRAKAGAVVEPTPGAFARAEYWNGLSRIDQELHLLRALQRIHPDWTFCWDSAAVAHGLPMPYSNLGRFHVATTNDRRCRSTKNVQRHIVEKDAATIARGIRVTSFERTVFDCLRANQFEFALAIADAALRRNGFTREKLARCFRALGKRCRNGSRPSRILQYADERSESPGESVARAVMVKEGFAMPELQVRLPNPIEPWRSYRVDFLWMREDGTRVIGEFDGRAKYEDPMLRGGKTALRVLEDERRRKSLLSVYGMPIVRFSYRDVMDRVGFVRLLKRFDIPQSDEVAAEERRLEESGSLGAQIFTLVSLEGMAG